MRMSLLILLPVDLPLEVAYDSYDSLLALPWECEVRRILFLSWLIKPLPTLMFNPLRTSLIFYSISFR